jgi:hypothetical protein
MAVKLFVPVGAANKWAVPKLLPNGVLLAGDVVLNAVSKISPPGGGDIAGAPTGVGPKRLFCSGKAKPPPRGRVEMGGISATSYSSFFSISLFSLFFEDESSSAGGFIGNNKISNIAKVIILTAHYSPNCARSTSKNQVEWLFCQGAE